MKHKSEIDIVHLSQREIREIKSDVAALKKMLANDKQSRQPKITDETEFVKDIKRKEKLLTDHSPRPFKSKVNENKAYEWTKRAEKWLSEQMPTSRDYYQSYPKEMDRYGNPIPPDHNQKQAFERAVTQQMRFQSNKKVQGVVQAYKHIMRRLEPSNPEVTNIEALRR